MPIFLADTRFADGNIRNFVFPADEIKEAAADRRLGAADDPGHRPGEPTRGFGHGRLCSRAGEYAPTLHKIAMADSDDHWCDALVKKLLNARQVV